MHVCVKLKRPRYLTLERLIVDPEGLKTLMMVVDSMVRAFPLMTPDDDLPVLFVDIKDDALIHGADTYLKADDQMHLWFDATFADCPLHRLWGLSLFGTSRFLYPPHRMPFAAAKLASMQPDM